MKVPFVPEPTERLRRRRRPVWLPAPIGLDWIGFIAPSLVFPLATTACPPKPAHHRRRRSLPSVHPPAPPGHHHDHYCYHYHHHHHARRHHRPKKQQSPAVSSFFPPLVVPSLAVSSCLPRAPFSSPFPSSGPQGAAEPAADDSTVDRRPSTLHAAGRPPIRARFLWVLSSPHARLSRAASRIPWWRESTTNPRAAARRRCETASPRTPLRAPASRF